MGKGLGDEAKDKVNREVKYEVSYEIICVAATSNFTVFKQHIWSMKIDPSV